MKADPIRWLDAGDGFRRAILFHPAYDLDRQGRAGVRIQFLLMGPDGAVQFVLHTGWGIAAGGELPADVGYHGRRPVHGSEFHTKDCPILGGPCWYDGSGLKAQDAFSVLTRSGGEALWDYLKSYYFCVFHGR